MALTTNKAVLNWIDEMAAMTQPDQIVWIDGSDAQIEALRAQACATGEMEKLNQELLPDCYLHRTAVNDVPGWRIAPSSAATGRRTPVPPTTGWIRRRCTPSSKSSTPAP